MFFKKIILSLLELLAIIVMALAASYFYVENQIKEPLDKIGIYKSFMISSGEGISRISENLAKDGIIKNPFYFKIYVWEKRLAKFLKAGEYTLSSEMSIPEIAEILAKGRVAEREVPVLIPEGLAAGEIEKILIEKGILKKGEFADAVKKENVRKYYPSYQFLEDKPSSQNLEGYLFPDTYKFYRETTPEEVVTKMLNNFGVKLNPEMRQEIANQKKSIFEILTLASIVQEEASGPGDMKIIAGIFWNRLAFGKALEADSTINFITGKKMSQALFSDLEIDSPYNTYKHAGLPPGPIANPGLDAIKAAIWPEKTDYLYFLHTPEGKTVFGRTYEEHLRNKEKYL